MDTEYLLDLPGRKQAENPEAIEGVLETVWRAPPLPPRAAEIAVELVTVQRPLNPPSLCPAQRIVLGGGGQGGQRPNRIPLSQRLDNGVMETGQLDQVLQSQLPGKVRGRSSRASVPEVVEEIPEHRLVACLLELVGPGKVRSVGVKENAVETLLNKGPQDAQSILSVDAVELGGRVNEGAQRVKGRRLRQDEPLDFEGQGLQRCGNCERLSRWLRLCGRGPGRVRCRHAGVVRRRSLVGGLGRLDLETIEEGANRRQ